MSWFWVTFDWIAVVYMDEDDIATYTIKTIDDPRTMNKTVYIRPPENILTQTQLIEKWENIIGRKLEKNSISGEDFLALMKGTKNLYMYIHTDTHTCMYVSNYTSSISVMLRCRYGLCWASWNWSLLSHILWGLLNKLRIRGRLWRGFWALSRSPIHSHGIILENLCLKHFPC